MIVAETAARVLGSACTDGGVVSIASLSSPLRRNWTSGLDEYNTVKTWNTSPSTVIISRMGGNLSVSYEVYL